MAPVDRTSVGSPLDGIGPCPSRGEARDGLPGTCAVAVRPGSAPAVEVSRLEARHVEGVLRDALCEHGPKGRGPALRPGAMGPHSRSVAESRLVESRSQSREGTSEEPQALATTACGSPNETGQQRSLVAPEWSRRVDSCLPNYCSVVIFRIAASISFGTIASLRTGVSRSTMTRSARRPGTPCSSSSSRSSIPLRRYPEAVTKSR